MSFKSFYLSEVLGVKKYLCPENIFSIRHFKGDLPCNVLAVTLGENSLKENQLLHKIMKSMDFSNFTLLELKNLNFLETFMDAVEDEGLANFVIFFGQKLCYDKFRQVKYLKTYSLEELEGNTTSIQVRKKELWVELKKWKSN